MSLAVNDDVVLQIEKPVAGGRMLGRHDGQVVLVAGTIPGERVRAHVTRVARGVVFAEVCEILHAVADRRGMAEDHPCGGELYSHIAYDRQIALKAEVVADGFARVARLALPGPVEVRPSREDGYRMRARLHEDGGRLGFYREGTHLLCDPAGTRQLLPATLEVLRHVERALGTWGGPPLLGIEISENIPGSERALHFELGGRVTAGDLAPFRHPDITGATVADGRDRVPRPAFGDPAVQDVIDLHGSGPPVRVTIERQAPAFFQANRYLFPALLERVAQLVDPGEVVDLYAGVGGFALALAALGCGAVTAVEGDRASAEDLYRNLAPWPQVRVAAMPVERYLAGRPPTPGLTVIVDPPRTGMTRDALSGLLGLGARRIVYVSCDVATLARDAARIVAAGYGLVGLEGFDLFPNTAHVEAVAAFTRA